MGKKSSLSPFGIKVKKKLTELDMTQRELANKVGCDENYLTHIFRGRRTDKKYRAAIRSELGLDTQKHQPMKEVM